MERGASEEQIEKMDGLESVEQQYRKQKELNDIWREQDTAESYRAPEAPKHSKRKVSRQKKSKRGEGNSLITSFFKKNEEEPGGFEEMLQLQNREQRGLRSQG